MKINYDPIADAMYIYFSKKKSTRTEELRDDLLVDYNGKKMIGIEILDVSKKLARKDLLSVNETTFSFLSKLPHPA